MRKSDAHKTILFHYSILNVGGAEMSLLRMMRLLADHGWNVELVLSTGGGSLESRVDPRVKITRLRDKVAGHRFLAESNIPRMMLWLMLDCCPFLYSRIQWFARAIQFRFKRFDVAVISLHGLSPSFCCSYVRADKRLQWIRNDLAKCDPDGSALQKIRRYKHLIDTFVCVSNTAKNSLVSLFPDLQDRAIVMYNIIDSKEMLARAAGEDNPYVAYGGSLKVVTVCRLSDDAKGLFRMLKINRLLLDSGIKFRWFVVGDGPDRKTLSRVIIEQGMEENFILVGRKDNPFPYYRFADISATLSYYEGLCGTVNEAKVMGRPVIATRVSGIEEQITDGVNGLIVENNEQAIFRGMKKMLTESALRKKLTNNILPESIMNDESKIRLFHQAVEAGQGIHGKKPIA